MYFPKESEFVKLSKKGNLIPVYTEISADFETPVSAFLKLSSNSKYCYLLESVEGQEKIARFSFLGYDACAMIKIDGKRLEILNKKGPSDSFVVSEAIELGDPLSEIRKFMSKYKLVNIDGLPRFCGGLVGYFGYDVVRFFEDIPDKNYPEKFITDATFLLTDTLVIFDHLRHKLKIVACAFLQDKKLETIHSSYRKSIKKIEEIIEKFKSRLQEEEAAVKKAPVKFNFLTKKKDFVKMVNKAKEYIQRGDIIQVVLSQILSAKIHKKPFDIYRKLRGLNPSAYMFYLKLSDLHLVGSSPEMLVRCEDRIVTTRPIAGTRPRGKNDEQDLKLEEELLKDTKEKAEHIMLVDLGRNDLGRVCKFGTVKVTEFMGIEKYSHVMHIVSEVQGKLKEGKDSYDVLRAAFPAGTVSGSPKIRAMEIIDELENYRRGPYAGSVGYFGFSGNLDTCITIRTIVIKNNTAYIQAGAGIVADSLPEREYQETLNKAKAQLEALI